MKKMLRRGSLYAALALSAAAGLTVLLSPSAAQAQSLLASTCNDGPANPPACNPGIVHGDRREGWMAQGRCEVMARNGIVATSQPLAAQAGHAHPAARAATRSMPPWPRPRPWA